MAGTVHTVELATVRLTDLVVAAESDHDSAEAPIIGSPIGAPPVRLDGITVVLSTSGTLLAIDDEGTERWSWASSSSTPSSGLAADGERVFLPGTDGRLLAFDAHDGRPAWHVERLGRREPGVWSTPLVIGDVLLAVCSTGHLIAVAAADGREIFSERLPGAPVATRLETDAEGRFLVATLGQEMKVACWSLES